MLPELFQEQQGLETRDHGAWGRTAISKESATGNEATGVWRQRSQSAAGCSFLGSSAWRLEEQVGHGNPDRGDLVAEGLGGT
jgi:hypothetical protein